MLVTGVYGIFIPTDSSRQTRWTFWIIYREKWRCGFRFAALDCCRFDRSIDWLIDWLSGPLIDHRLLARLVDWFLRYGCCLKICWILPLVFCAILNFPLSFHRFEKSIWWMEFKTLLWWIIFFIAISRQKNCHKLDLWDLNCKSAIISPTVPPGLLNTIVTGIICLDIGFLPRSLNWFPERGRRAAQHLAVF